MLFLLVACTYNMHKKAENKKATGSDSITQCSWSNTDSKLNALHIACTDASDMYFVNTIILILCTM